MIKFECNDQTIRQVSATQRFVYRCLNMFGPDKSKRSDQAKKELMDHWAKRLFDFCHSTGGYWNISMKDSIVTLKIHSGIGTPYQELTIDFDDPVHSIFNVEYDYKH